MSYRILVLSDLHLGEPGSDPRYDNFLKVLRKFRDSDWQELFLMGDIFDILIGAKPFWRKIHPDFFAVLEAILSSGKKVTWVQGNHDFQLGRLLRPMGVQWIDDGEVVERAGLKIYLSHGDLADESDKLHPLWRAFLGSKFLAAFIYLLPNTFAERYVYPLTRKISRASRKASYVRDAEREEKTRKLFRRYAGRLAQQHQAQLVVLGHSHINDDFALEPAARYLNFGSWFDQEQVGILQLEADARFNAKVSSASAWLQSSSQ